jgi:uncharacterized protein YhjY with autotransporter beta-barrel domain
VLRGHGRPWLASIGAVILFGAAGIVLLTGLARPASAQTFTLTIQPNTLPPATAGVPYSTPVTAVGGNSNYTLTVSVGSLPSGLSLVGSAGSYVISGTPSAPGSSFTIEATDIDANTGYRPYTFSVGSVGGISIAPASLPNGTQNVAYNQTLTPSGGTGPYVFTLTSGTLPAGVTLSSGGVISGTPTNGGSFNIDVGVTDSAGNTGSRSYSLQIGTNSLTVLPTSLPNGTLSAAYTQTVTATGGTGGPYTFSLTSGALPTGTSMDSAGAITGTANATGTYNFTVRAVDGNNNFGSRAYTVHIGTNSLTVDPPTLPGGVVASAYSQTVTASGGTGPYTFAVSSGALPNGLTLASGGGLTGTPTLAGTYNFDVTATDAGNNTGLRSYSVVIAMAPLTVNPTSLPNGTLTTPYNQTVTTSGGVAPYSYVISGGALPTGLSMSAGGAITGTPTVAGPYTFTVEATDAQPNTGTRTYTVNIGSNILAVAPTSLPSGTQNVAYSQTVSASGGNGPYTFTVSSGALPAGLTLSSAGAITGTPSSGGIANFTVRALDTLGNIGTRAYTVSIGTVSLTVNPTSLPGTVVGKAYRQTVSATGGTAPYTFSLSSGALPPGLALNGATGVISGTPTSVGSATFTVRALDINGNIGSRAYTLASRADPALDAEVRGLIASQVATAQRFAAAQINNVTRHLEGLHDRFDACSFNFGIAPQSAPPPQSYGNGYGALGYAGASQLYSPNDAYGALARYQPQPPQSVSAPPPGPVAQRMPYEQACAADWASSMSAWTAGAISFGSVTPSGAASNRFTTAGLTVGVDSRVSEKLIVGAALGFGTDSSEIGSNGSRSEAISYSGTLYASLKPADLLFIDAAVGYGTLGFKNQRFVTGDGSVASGDRKGSYWFGAVTASVELGRDNVKFAPYVSADMISATFDGYSEQGGSALTLSYDAMKAKAVSGAIGLRGSIDIPTERGVLTPNARIEYRETRQSAFDQLLYYSDLGAGSASTFTQAEASSGTTTAALGLRARMAGGVTAEVEYSITRGAADYLAQAIRAALRIAF